VKWKLDENMPAEVISDLRAAGQDVETVVSEGLGGADDVLVARKASEEGRILVTLDMDLADIRRFPPTDYAGIVVLRLGKEGKSAVRRALQQALGALMSQPLEGRLAIVSHDGVRLRN
jgi:predicted nuclease of predicted toxin-antitoxin system